MRGLLVATTVFCLMTGVAVAQNGTLVVTPDQVRWGPAPGLPADWQAAVLIGDPAKSDPYVERVKLPPNATVPPHTHPDIENITVISGSFGIGQGSVPDKSKGQMLPAGSFYRLPANTAHFAWSGPDGAVIQIHGIGPSGIKMIEAAADKM
jgi:quercetin dioxygenase-like cupin family protein